jgi:hypothetical protein
MNYDTVISWFQSLLSKWVNLCRCSKGQMWGYIGGTACLVLSFILITGMTLGGVSTWWSLGIGRVGTFHVILLDVSITCYFAVKTHAINDSQYDSHVTNLTPGSAAP